MQRDWSQVEVDAVVRDYFAMLDKQLRGITYVKAEHRHALLSEVDGRTEKSIERKHSNISAVLVELGYPYLSGYKPLHNYQRMLVDVVTARLSTDEVLEQSVARSADAPAAVPSVEDLLSRLVDAPSPPTAAVPAAREAAVEWRVRRGVDYLQREARNVSLGLAGEQFVFNFERARLLVAGADRLVDKVEHVAVTQGDGLGYDIRSYTVEGADLLIEVKTTGYGMLTPFFVSPKELSVSRTRFSDYALYRLFDFRDNPRLFAIRGAIDTSCAIEPTEYLAKVL